MGAEQRKRAVERVAEITHTTPAVVELESLRDPYKRINDCAISGWERAIVADGLLREASGLEMSEELYQRIRSFLSAEA